MNKRIFLAATVAMALSTSHAQINRGDATGYYERATAMFETGNYAGCFDQMTEALRLDREAAFAEDAHYYIAMAAMRQHRPDAEALLTRFLDDYPASARRSNVTMAIGDICYDRGDLAEALSFYLKADPSTLDGASAENYRYRVAYCRLMSNDLDDARRLYESLVNTRRYGNDAMFYLGYIDYARHDYEAALDRFRKVVVKTDGPTAMTDFYLGQIYYMKRDYDKALSTSMRLLSLDGIGRDFRAEASRVAGESCYSLDRLDQAVTYLRQYVGLTDSPLPSALYVLGLSEYRTGDYLQAIDDLTPVTGQDNAMGQSAYLMIGQSYLREGNYTAAMMALDNAYRMTFDDQIRETALYNYAVARMQGGRVPFGSSVATFETFLKRYPDSRYAPEVQEYIINGYMTDNNYEAALASINAIARPTDAVLDAKQQIAYTLGTRDLASGNATRAINRFREAKALGNRNQAIYRECDLWIGECLYKEGKYAQAAKAYQDYLKGPRTLPNRSLANYDLGYALFGEKKFDKAYGAFDSFVTNPGQASSLMKADALNRMGDCLYYDSSFDRAEKLYDRAFDADPAAGDYALYQKAIMKGLRRRHREKIEGLDDMIARFPSSGLYPSALLEIADAWQELNDSRNAIATYERLVGNFPETAQGRQGRLLLAITWLNDGNRPKAVEIYKEVIANYPSSDEARTAADDLKRIYADNGNLTDFVAFMKSVPNAPSVDPSEIEDMSFESASRSYEKSGDTSRMSAYVSDYPDGRHVAEALICLARESSKAGNPRQALDRASKIVSDYPHSPVAEEAYLIKAAAEADLDMTRTSLQTYAELEARASSSAALNASRLGIVRTALDLDEAETALTAADRLLSSTTIGSSDRDEVNFSRALALERLGDADRAEETWRELAADPQQLYGAKAAFYLARHYFDNGDMKQSREVVENLVNANPPHIYWLARGFILLSDINRAQGNTFEADEYLKSLRENYPGTEPDIFLMIDQRLNK